MIEYQKAITDLIAFISEFELWLEGNTLAHKPDNGDIEARIKYDTLWDVLDKYRECKKRIEYDNG